MQGRGELLLQSQVKPRPDFVVPVTLTAVVSLLVTRACEPPRAHPSSNDIRRAFIPRPPVEGFPSRHPAPPIPGGSMKYPEARNYVGGSFVGTDRPFIEVFNPSDGSVIS